MPQRRRDFADRINYREQASPSRAQDPLCAIAPLLRVRPELQAVCQFASQWDVPHDAKPAGWAQFHIVTTGNCLLERSGGHPLRLEAGDVLLLPHGDAHVVRSSARMCGSKSPIRIEHGNAIETKTNTEGKAATELICGRLHFEAAADSLVIATLPDVIVLRLGKEPLLDRMRMLVRAIHDELKGGRLGALAVATDLASALFVQMLRVHCERASDAGTLRLLSSLPSARAVSAMLRAPGHDWTLDALAAEAHVSRASLVRIFRKTAGVAPLAFLTDLRLGLARQRLASTEASIARVAAEVGYQSESAFARAFHRRFKTTPGRIRASRIT
jgi:AraC family transcriptional regulator, activator of mtrCDE